jgi:hypothetical protein
LPILRFHKWSLVILICLMVLGILFNGFILMTFVHLPRIRSFTNNFVASLALVDMMMVILMPILILSFLLLTGKLEFVVNLIYYFVWFCAMTSLLNFACISVDRMLAIAKPLYHRTLPRSRCIKVIAFTWIFPALATTALVYLYLRTTVDSIILTCLHFCIGFVIPTLITVASYVIIARVVLCRRRINVHQVTNHYNVNRVKHTIRLAWKILLVISPSIVMWNLYWIVMFIILTNAKVTLSFSVTEVASLVPISVAVVNPLILTLMTSDFRIYLLKWIRCRTDVGRTTGNFPHMIT